MIDLGQHAVFIVWSYLGVAAVLGALIAWTMVSARRADRRLAELDRLRGRSRS